MTAASLLFPADPNIWIDNFSAIGGAEAWFRDRKTTTLAPWATAQELAMHGQIMKKGGFTGPLNWYKQAMAGITHGSETKIKPGYAETKFAVPTLFVGCEKDVICIPQFQVAGMQGLFEDLTCRSLEAGHWCMLERPGELWEIIHGWIEEKRKGI